VESKGTFRAIALRKQSPGLVTSAMHRATFLVIVLKTRAPNLGQAAATVEDPVRNVTSAAKSDTLRGRARRLRLADMEGEAGRPKPGKCIIF
jgi:predicted aminopeptidase